MMTSGAPWNPYRQRGIRSGLQRPGCRLSYIFRGAPNLGLLGLGAQLRPMRRGGRGCRKNAPNNVELFHGTRDGLTGGKFSLDDVSKRDTHLTSKEPAVFLTDDPARAIQQYATPKGQVAKQRYRMTWRRRSNNRTFMQHGICRQNSGANRRLKQTSRNQIGR